jgi:uncharacterized protein YbjT (DUF2867 family)
MLLVTGATGNVGKAVIAELAAQNVPVRVLVRDPAKLGAQPASVEVVQGDFSDDASLGHALRGVDAAFLASSFNPKMVEMQTRFVTTAKNAGVKRLVQLSGVGANAQMCCARTLRWLGQIEAAAETSGMSVTHLRPTFFMQNLFAFAASIRQQGLIAGPFRSGKWTWVDARDVGAVAAKALRDPTEAGKTYTVTGGDTLSYAQIAEHLSRVLERPVKYVDITANEARGRLQAVGDSPVMIEAKLELWDACASNLVNVAPTDVVEKVTGKAPRSFDEFARDYRAKFQ